MGLLDNLLKSPTVLGQKLPTPIPRSLQSEIRKIQSGVEKLKGVSDIVKRAIAGRADPPQYQTPVLGQTWIEVRGRPDPQSNLQWDCYIIVPGLGLDISPNIEEVRLPADSFQSTEVFRDGTMVPHAEVENYGDLSLRLYEDMTLSSYRFFRKWRSSIRNNNGDFGLPSEYMGRIVVYARDPAGTKTVKFDCQDAFPTSIDGYTWASGQPDRQILNVSLAVTRMIVTGADSSSPSTKGPNLTADEQVVRNGVQFSGPKQRP